jgi:hypothetical protein
MNVGKIIQPLQIKPGIPRKTLFKDYSHYVMSQVEKLILSDETSKQDKIKNERFDLKVVVWDQNKQDQSIPNSFQIRHDAALAKFFHRPPILKLFRSNLKLPIDPLEHLDKEIDPKTINRALESILNYLKMENPYLLSYRFGPIIGEEMLLGLRELHDLTQWAENENFGIKITPIRYFFYIDEDNEIVQTVQGSFKRWM